MTTISKIKVKGTETPYDILSIGMPEPPATVSEKQGYVLRIKEDATDTTGVFTEWIAPTTVATDYTLPTASTDTLGGVKVDGTSITISNGVISTSLQSAGGVSIANSSDGQVLAYNSTSGLWQNTTLSTATTDANGLMSSTDKSKVNAITLSQDGKISASSLDAVNLSDFKGTVTSKSGAENSLTTLSNVEAGDFAYISTGDDAGAYICVALPSSTADNWKLITNPTLTATVTTSGDDNILTFA